MVNYLNFHTIVNMIGFWIVLMMAEFKIKRKYPEMIKDYIMGMGWKFMVLQCVSFLVLVTMLFVIPIGNDDKLNNVKMWDIINLEIFGIAYLVHSLIPIFISFVLIRLYLGHVYSLNKLVSRKYGYQIN